MYVLMMYHYAFINGNVVIVVVIVEYDDGG